MTVKRLVVVNYFHVETTSKELKSELRRSEGRAPDTPPTYFPKVVLAS